MFTVYKMFGDDLLLFGDETLNIVSNRMILEATILFTGKNKAAPLILSVC